MESMPRDHAVREVRARSGVPRECELELPGFGPVEAANDSHMAQLARAIEYEIIPRLMLAHRAGAEPTMRPDDVGRRITADDVAQFATLVLSHEEDLALSSIEGLRTTGVSVEQIYLELLAPTARHLGELWEEDLCNFTDVTVGLGRLQRVLRELSPALGRSVEHPLQGRRILLLPSPGELHTFGLVMVAEFFRSAGWDVNGGAWVTGVEAPGMVASEWFDVIGFSMGAAVNVPALAATITAVRHATCNKDIAVLVGGPLFGEHPEFVARLGADGMTIDGREAPLLAERLIAGITGQRDSQGG